MQRLGCAGASVGRACACWLLFFTLRAPCAAAVSVAAGLPPAAAPSLPSQAAATPLPAAADEKVALTVSERIQEDSGKAGNVAKSLLEVQEQIERVEHEVLGKVFDMESLKSFLGSHKDEVDTSKGLVADVTSATKEVERLHAQLMEARNKEISAEQAHRQQIEALRKSLSDGVAESAKLQAEINQDRQLEASDASLRAGLGALNRSDEAAMDELEKARLELETLQKERGKRQKHIEALKAAVLQQSDYFSDCGARASKLQQEVMAEKARTQDRRNHAAERERRIQQAHQEQVRQNDVLKDRLQKAKANLATIQASILATRERHVALDQEGQAQLGRLRTAFGEIRQREDAAEGELTARVQHRRNLEKSIHQKEAEVRKMQGILLGGLLAELRRNNTMLKKDIGLTHASLQASQINVAEATGKVALANVTLGGLRHEAAEHQAAAQRASQEALAQIATTKKGDEDARARAEKATLEAEASMLTDCVAIWDKQNADILKVLDECQPVKGQLEVGKAQVATLTSGVQASQETQR